MFNLNSFLGVKTYNPGIVMHELLHTAGMYHEHQRPDRDQYVTILFMNMLVGK